MEALKLKKYGTLDTEVPVEGYFGAETNAGDVKHNGAMGLPPGQLQSGQARTTEPATNMANDLLTQAEADPRSAADSAHGHELDAFLGKAFEEKPIWTGLYESIRDVFFPPKLPPLELTSTPIPVPDPMAVKANPWAIGISTTTNLLILALVLYFGVRTVIQHINPPMMTTPIDVGDFKAPKDLKLAGGGGGGGDRSIIEASKGKLPKIDDKPIVPPQVQTFDNPKIPVPPALDVQKNITLPDNPTMPNLGMKTGVNVVLSNGTGNGGGIGTGSGGGLGSGSGDGYGPGSGGNTGGGLYQIGGRVSAPVPLNTVEAEFSDEARRAKYQGVCLISMIVDTNGNPQNPRVVRALGMGLDEKALEAVRKYKFKPAMKDGKTPVPVMITVEVNFRLY
ncbi:MAG TPA: energy transducer TonB [Terracidiphilus sp.]|nr:energy transducer TonB [Terracidiphilus sp.]